MIPAGGLGFGTGALLCFFTFFAIIDYMLSAAAMEGRSSALYKLFKSRRTKERIWELEQLICSRFFVSRFEGRIFIRRFDGKLLLGRFFISRFDGKLSFSL